MYKLRYLYPGPGNITTNTSNAYVIGTDTDFANLSVGTTLLTNSNVYIGSVAAIIDSGNLFLTANANVAVLSNSYNANVHYFAKPVETFGYDLGNITVSKTTNIVTGRGTYFANTITAGDKILVANNQSITFAFDYVGTVDTVFNNTKLFLQDASIINSSNAQFAHGKPEFLLLPQQNLPAELRIPYGYNNILNHKFDAVDHGVFGNHQTIHSYHPPIPDPVTGVMVNVPATVFKKSSANGSQIKTISSHKYGEVSDNGLVDDFDIPTGKFGTSLYNVVDNLTITDTLQALIDANVDAATYSQLVSTLYPTTSADIMASQLGRRLPRVTDTLDNAKVYLDRAKPPVLSDEQKQNLSQTNDLNLRPFPRELKQLETSKSPVNYPGLLSAVTTLKRPQANAYVRPTYYYPQFSRKDRL